MTEQKENMVDELLELAAGNVRKADVPEELIMEEWTFTNDKSNPMIRQLFHMFVESVFRNKVGLMHAKNAETGEINTLVVGVEITENGVVTWPIAKILTEEEQGKFLAPDGEGGFIGDE